MQKVFRNLPVICLLIFSSCTKDDPVSSPPLSRPPSVAGVWKDNAIPLVVTLIESDGIITGAGTILDYYSLSVNGKNKYPSINFSIGSNGYVPVTFTGRFFSKDSMSGTLDGNIFYNTHVNLIRTH